MKYNDNVLFRCLLFLQIFNFLVICCRGSHRVARFLQFYQRNYTILSFQISIRGTIPGFACLQLLTLLDFRGYTYFSLHARLPIILLS